MLKAQKEAGLMAKPSGSNQYKDRSQGDTDPLTLADVGISKTLSSRSQKIAELPEEEFEEILESHRSIEKPVSSPLEFGIPYQTEIRKDVRYSRFGVISGIVVDIAYSGRT